MKPVRFCALAVLLAALAPVHAEKGDREKPIHIEASRVSVDEINKVQIYEGSVVLIQGTMQLRTDRLVVTQDADGFQKGVATGGPNGRAQFRQKRDGREEYIEGEAERIAHDAYTEKTEFFVRASIRSGQDEVKGHYISYEATTERYLVTNSGAGQNPSAGGAPSRVRAIIQPKSKPEQASDTTQALTLTPANEVAPR